MVRVVTVATAAAAILCAAIEARALSEAACPSRKVKATAKKAEGMLKCHDKAAARGIAVDPLCLPGAEPVRVREALHRGPRVRAPARLPGRRGQAGAAPRSRLRHRRGEPDPGGLPGGGRGARRLSHHRRRGHRARHGGRVGWPRRVRPPAVGGALARHLLLDQQRRFPVARRATHHGKPSALRSMRPKNAVSPRTVSQRSGSGGRGTCVRVQSAEPRLSRSRIRSASSVPA